MASTDAPGSGTRSAHLCLSIDGEATHVPNDVVIGVDQRGPLVYRPTRTRT